MPATINHTWGFRNDDTDWKSPGDITFKLVDIVSKGGNYLLNVGPMAAGVIPQASQDNLRAVGKWLKVNGEAIYGAGPTPFGEEMGSFDKTGTDRKGGPLFVAATDWRCTTKPGKLYIHLFKYTGGEFDLSHVKGKVSKAYMLANKKSVKVAQSGDTVKLALPAQPTSEYASVVVLETKERLLRPPPPAAHQVDGGARFQQGIARRLDAVHARKRVEDDALRVVVVLRNRARQLHRAELHLRTRLRPVRGRVVHRVAVARHRTTMRWRTGPRATRSTISSIRKLRRFAAAAAASRYSLPAAGSTR